MFVGIVSWSTLLSADRGVKAFGNVSLGCLSTIFLVWTQPCTPRPGNFITLNGRDPAGQISHGYTFIHHDIVIQTWEVSLPVKAPRLHQQQAYASAVDPPRRFGSLRLLAVRGFAALRGAFCVGVWGLVGMRDSGPNSLLASGARCFTSSWRLAAHRLEA